VLVVNGDRVIESSSVSDVIEVFESGSATAAMAVLERQDASQYGAVTLRDRDIERLVEKPDTGDYRLINAGIYAFEETVFEAIEETPREAGELALTDTISRIRERERIRGVDAGGLWVDATYPWDLLEVAAELLARGRVGEPRDREGVWVDADASVDDEATLRAPVVVGPDSEVAPGAVVGPNVALGQNVTVGPNATVEQSVLDADARVDAGSTLRDAVLGQDVHLGAGTTIPGGLADVRVGTDVYEDQRLGAVVGDRTRAVGTVTFEPGALVGPNVRLGPGVYVRGTVNEGAEVVR
jgi:glucose-1-phosphate thymidylyltransferase